jgi:type VI protein secretion system component Hcp
MYIRRFASAAAAASLLMAAGPAMAASDYLLQLDGVNGDGQDRTASQTIEVDSFSWGVSRPGSAKTSPGGGAGKVNVQDLSMTKVNVQDLSMTSAHAPRDASSGMATGKRAAPVADADGDGHTDAVAAAPKVGDVATFTVVTRESPSKSSTGKTGACATGTHFPHAVIVARGQRYEFSDVVVTSCTVVDGQRKKDYRGHVTLMK